MSLESQTSRVATVEGCALHHHIIGSGPPLVLLQAFGPLPGTSAWLTYERVVEPFAKHFRCILVDYPNFGRTSPIVFDEPVHDLYVRLVLGLLDELRIHSTKVVGVSTGGTVAIDLAIAAPGRVEAMVIGGCEASTGGEPGILTPSPTEVARRFAESQTVPPDREAIRRLLEAIVYDPSVVTQRMVDAMYGKAVREPEHAKCWSESRSVPHSNLAELPGIECPTLIVHGRADRMVGLEQALRLLSLIPNSDLVALNRCGHWGPVERPADFVAHALPFLVGRPA